MMHAFRYILVGGGMAAAAAVEGIRRHDPHGSIGLFSQDRYPPYSRPPLSKGLWRGKRLETIWRYKDPAAIGVTEHLNATVTAIAPQEHRIHLDDGRSFTYDRLLLATGAEPRRLPGDPAGVQYLRSLDDYLNLFRLARGKRFAVIGGGFIGAEMAAALRDQDKDVHMVFPESAILESILPADLAQAVSGYYQDKGVRVSAGLGVEAARAGDGQVSLRLSNGEDLAVDAVVAGLGVLPRTELAEAAGLYVQDGVVVDSFGRTSDQDIYAAGDIARIPVPALGTTLRVEHEDNAVSRGRVAGANMAGAGEEAVDAPLFYSDLFDLGFEAVGVLDSRLETYADWVEPYRRGVVYYVRDGQVQGVLNWNVWDQVPAARALLGTACSSPAQLKGRVPLG